jgi:DNA-binding response OmpR family regulator
MMPLMDGLKLISTLRADPGYASVPILLMSAVDAAKTRTQHPDVPFIQKPFDVDDLVTRVRELVHAGPPGGDA